MTRYLVSEAQSSLYDAPHLDRLEQPTSGKMHRNARKAEKRAARNAAAITGIRRVQCAQALATAGFDGLTRQEIADHFGIRIQSVTSAINALINDYDPAMVQETPRERDGGAVCTLTYRGWRAVEALERQKATA